MPEPDENPCSSVPILLNRRLNNSRCTFPSLSRIVTPAPGAKRGGKGRRVKEKVVKGLIAKNKNTNNQKKKEGKAGRGMGVSLLFLFFIDDDDDDGDGRLLGHVGLNDSPPRHFTLPEPASGAALVEEEGGVPRHGHHLPMP